jgi:hypothetical protein
MFGFENDQPKEIEHTWSVLTDLNDRKILAVDLYGCVEKGINCTVLVSTPALVEREYPGASIARSDLRL